jgi:radical SAM superfamily enzyme YgiQ (UPF0313 family)
VNRDEAQGPGTRRRALLISTYELGRQPFGLASPAAWLRGAGWDVDCVDLARERLRGEVVTGAALVGVHLPMHTATRLAAPVIAKVRELNPSACICAYGLYAPLNRDWLRSIGVDEILGGEFEEDLAAIARRIAAGSSFDPSTGSGSSRAIPRLHFLVPDRRGLPSLDRYATLQMPDGSRRLVGSTEASRGCRHLCRHCPIVPVYEGQFRIVAADVVLADIDAQVAAGAQHITFGDPDFFNGPAHALSIVEAMHREFPDLSYDVTIKIEHLRKHDVHLATLRDTGCLFVISAVESVDDFVLEKFDKGHTRADFLTVAARFRELGMTLLPTFVPFTPWTTLEGYNDLLDVIAQLDLCENVAPIQLAIRLLIPAGSRLLELPDVRAMVGQFDSAALIFPWKHADARVDALCHEISELVQRGEKLKLTRTEIFTRIRRAARAAAGKGKLPSVPNSMAKSTPVPFLDEPWYCCAEPMDDQFVSIGKVKEAVAKADQFV